MGKLGKYTKVEYDSLKAQKKFFFEQIENANQGLIDIRQICDHPETELVTYSTRPGQNWDNTEICSICGEVVNWPQDNWRHKPKDDMEKILERDGSHVHIKNDSKKLSSDFKTSGTK